MPPNRWLMLGLGMSAQTASCVYLFGMPFLVPQLRAGYGLSLGQAGLLVGAPSVGLVLALIGWGALADRYGERWVMAIGLAGSGVTLVGAAAVGRPVPLGLLLVLAGAWGASVNAASGRVVLGWFPPHRRGLAMGWRQTAQPLGVALAAATLPGVAARFGVPGALLLGAALCLVTAVAVALLVVDPPRPAGGPGTSRGNPYRTPVLWRIHGASSLLVVPQFAVAAFALAYLVGVAGLAAPRAGALIAVAGVAGAGARLLAGRLSDRVGSRLRPMRALVLIEAAVVGVLAAVAGQARAGTVLVALAAVCTVSTNGLAFTAVAELAGGGWAGRALGVQNTAQNVVAAATPGLIGLLIGAAGYPAAFGIAAGCALAAAVVLPTDRWQPGPAGQPAASRADPPSTVDESCRPGVDAPSARPSAPASSPPVPPGR